MAKKEIETNRDYSRRKKRKKEIVRVRKALISRERYREMGIYYVEEEKKKKRGSEKERKKRKT